MGCLMRGRYLEQNRTKLDKVLRYVSKNRWKFVTKSAVRNNCSSDQEKNESPNI